MATILIVDDELDCRRPLATLLKCEGYEVHEACNGQEGMDALNRRSYDLVLLDLVMPVMDGVQVLQAVRGDAKWANLPIFLVTAQHETQLLRNAREIGIDEYIFKGDTPFMKMLELIKRHLGEAFTPRRRGRKPKPRPEAELAAAQLRPVSGGFYSPAPVMVRPAVRPGLPGPVVATPVRTAPAAKGASRPRKWSQLQLEFLRRDN